MSKREQADQAFQMIKDAHTATYWLSQLKILTGTNTVTRGDWKNHPEFVDRIIKANGQEPS